MAIQQWEPLREMVSLREAMNSLLQDSFVRPTGVLGDANVAMLPLDIAETEDEFIIRASLPGVRPEDVQITVHGDTLTIRGEIKDEEDRNEGRYHLRERRFGLFQRTVTLSTPISADKAQAAFENGVLTLILPKAEESKPKQIRVGATSQGQAGQESRAQGQVGQEARAQGQAGQEARAQNQAGQEAKAQNQAGQMAGAK
jgi:HSP20 family protein